MIQDGQLRGSQSGTQDDDIIDLRAFVSTIWRGKWIVAAVATVMVALAFFYAFFVAVPVYRATAVVILETQQESVVDLQSVVGGFSGDTTQINSEVEVLRARTLMGKVVDTLDLTRDPEFNRDLRAPTLRQRVRGQIYAVLGRPEADAGVSPTEAAARQRDRVINALLDRVTVRNVPSSLVFQITVETENREKSARIADQIVESYILNQLEVKFEATEQATNWLTDRVAELQVQLEAAEARVSEFSAATSLVSVEQLQGLERQLKDLRDRILGAEAAKTQATAQLADLQRAEDRDAQAEVANDAQLDRLLVRARSDAAIATAFDTRFGQILARAELDSQRATQQLAALQDSVPELESQIDTQGEDLIALQQLQREAEANRLLYEYFLGRLKETSAQEGIQQADSRILSNSVVPREAAAPKKSLILAAAGVLGLILGSAVVLLREAGNNSFRTARELEAQTGEAVLGQIPVIPARNRKRTLAYLSEKPTSAAAEAIRNLRTSVLLSNVDKPPQVILSTSSIPGEGKTTNSLALAQNLIGMGKKVLLLEGDIRRRTFNQYFPNIPKAGLVSVLSGAAKLEDVIFRSPELDGDLLAGEKTSTNAADLFSSDAFRDFIARMRDTYDIVVIDSPPVLVVPDARIIAQHCDAVLFTVKWDSTSRAQVDESLRLFRDARLKVTGLVLSQISPRGMKRYGYGGEYGAYGGYGAQYYTN